MEKTFIFAGFGGQGMLLIGKFVVLASLLDDLHAPCLQRYSQKNKKSLR